MCPCVSPRVPAELSGGGPEVSPEALLGRVTWGLPRQVVPRAGSSSLNTGFHAAAGSYCSGAWRLPCPSLGSPSGTGGVFVLHHSQQGAQDLSCVKSPFQHDTRDRDPLPGGLVPRTAVFASLLRPSAGRKLNESFKAFSWGLPPLSPHSGLRHPRPPHHSGTWRAPWRAP